MVDYHITSFKRLDICSLLIIIYLTFSKTRTHPGPLFSVEVYSEVGGVEVYDGRFWLVHEGAPGGRHVRLTGCREDGHQLLKRTEWLQAEDSGTW